LFGPGRDACTAPAAAAAFTTRRRSSLLPAGSVGSCGLWFTGPGSFGRTVGRLYAGLPSPSFASLGGRRGAQPAGGRWTWIAAENMLHFTYTLPPLPHPTLRHALRLFTTCACLLPRGFLRLSVGRPSTFVGCRVKHGSAAAMPCHATVSLLWRHWVGGLAVHFRTFLLRLKRGG